MKNIIKSLEIRKSFKRKFKIKHFYNGDCREEKHLIK